MYFDLLKDWCDRLLELQIVEKREPRLYGGILCPAYMRVHGRSADAIFPLVTMTALTGRPAYLEGAKRLFDWSEHMLRPDGSYHNDTNSTWNGITVFAAIVLGETLLYHGALLDAQTRMRWQQRFARSCAFLVEHIDGIPGDVNYPISCSHAMALAWRLLGEERYARKARALAHWAVDHFTPEGLLFGEGKPLEGLSPKGCRPVDIGYNVEESLPSLAHYALLMDDAPLRERTLQAMRAHLAFMLPDGAWDNSWGTRSYKWSYWGSRTSDGCQAGFALLAGEEPLLWEAIARNTRLLRACTHEGLLYGGPMYRAAGEPACVHHTFCHAKALAGLLVHGVDEQDGLPLPSEQAQGLTYYPSIHTAQLRRGLWHATVTGYDFPYAPEGHASGGAMTLLWHPATGPVLVGTMEQYHLVEANNMQLPFGSGNICLTPRFEHGQGKTIFRSSSDHTARMACDEADGALRVKAHGRLDHTTQGFKGNFELEYRLEEERLLLSGRVDLPDARFVLPVVSARGQAADLDGNNARIASGHAIIALRASLPFQLPEAYQAADGSPLRMFNPVGGFDAVPLYVSPDAGKNFWIEIRVIA